MALDDIVYNFRLEFVRGASYDATIVFEDSAGHLVDFTGATAVLAIYADDEGPVLKQLATGGQGITLGGAAGSMALALVPADTEALFVAMAGLQAKLFCFVTFPNGKRVPWMQGTVVAYDAQPRLGA